MIVSVLQSLWCAKTGMHTLAMMYCWVFTQTGPFVALATSLLIVVLHALLRKRSAGQVVIGAFKAFSAWMRKARKK